ncbi:FkbM family methyltransferase [Sediminibacterium sp.]|uniref:FkbM family methyltransferase n=1 Tax=Sediminibacterium sp. TaxID=1917865 RepID=UPI0025CFD075|nr:FkbM family methyltransferase [Sediminibacterium sp.]MBW0179122.1 FkbM family methyltransferase [Sediminibacterium sp.]
MASRFKPLIKAFGLTDGLKFYIHLLFKKYGSFHSSLYGATFYLRKNFSDKYTFKQVFLDDQYNISLPFEPKTILDGGANIGLASAYFAHRFPDASIIAVEPSKTNFAMVEKNTAAFPQVKKICAGIWNKNAHLIIVNKADHDNAFMVEESYPENPEAIPAVSIEYIMKEQGWSTIDILKLDIEGSEKEVFEQGVDYWLPRTKAIFVEVHDHMRKGAGNAIFKAITKYHFSFALQHENLVFINEDLP